MRSRLAAILFGACGPALVAQHVASDLVSLRVGDTVIPFEAAVAIVVQSSPPVQESWYDREHHVRLRVTAIAGVELAADSDVTVRTSREDLGALKQGRRYRLTGRVGDAVDFGGGTEFSFATEQVQLLAPQNPKPAAVPKPQVDLRASSGERVELTGQLWSRNGCWWLESSEDVLLTDAHGRRRTFPTHWHGHRITVRGQLDWQLRLSRDEELVEFPVVLDADVALDAVEQDSEANEPNRFRQLHDRNPQLVNGVFELIALGEIQRNHLGCETAAWIWAVRNWPHFRHVLRQDDAAARDELARRVTDAARPAAMRALYAGALAANDDERGRRYLRDALSDIEPLDRDALYVLGAFFQWRDDSTCDVSWCEDLAIRCLRDAPGASCQFAQIPRLLARIGTQPCIEQLLQTYDAPPATNAFGSVFGDARAALRHALLLRLSPEQLPDEALLRMIDVTPADDPGHRDLCAALLARDHVATVDRFLDRISESFWDEELREHAGPKVLAAIEARLPDLTGDVRREAERLLRLRSPNAAERLYRRLGDADTPPKELPQLCWDLADFAHPGAAALAATVLRDRVLAPESGVVLDASRVRSVLECIGRSSEPDAVAAMISLLDADFRSQANEHIGHHGFRRLVAGQLAEMTGVSFGPDAAAWRAWLEKR